MFCRATRSGCVAWAIKKVFIPGASNCNRQFPQQEYIGQRWLRKCVQGVPVRWHACCRQALEGRGQPRCRNPIPNGGGNDFIGCTPKSTPLERLLYDAYRAPFGLPLHVQWQRCITPPGLEFLCQIFLLWFSCNSNNNKNNKLRQKPKTKLFRVLFSLLLFRV